MPPPLTTSNHLSFGHRPSAIAGLATSCPNFPRVFQAQANHRSTANHSHCSNASQPWLTLRAELNALMFVRPILVHPIPREQACLPAAPASNTRASERLPYNAPGPRVLRNRVLEFPVFALGHVSISLRSAPNPRRPRPG